MILKELEFIIPDRQPFAQKRHRPSYNGGMYDPSSEDKKIVQQWMFPVKPPKPLTGAFGVTITAFFQIPESWSQKKKDWHEGRRCPKYKDDDNIEKIIFDAMQGYLIEDDRMICENHTFKYYSIRPCTHVKLVQFDEPEY